MKIWKSGEIDENCMSAWQRISNEKVWASNENVCLYQYLTFLYYWPWPFKRHKHDVFTAFLFILII